MQDHIVLISGASAGIGQATARRFHQAGATVLLLARRLDRLHSLVDELGSRAHAFELDVTDGAAVESFFAQLPAPLQAITILVNNAGAAYGLETSQEANFSSWQAMVDLNVTALLRLTHAVLPGMVARRRGHIINLGSVAGTYPYPGGNVYGATKAFVEQFSLNLRCDLHGHNVRVTSVEPGLVETEFSLVRFAGDTDRAAAVYDGVEAMQAEDIAETIVWCASQPARVNVNRVELMATAQTPAGFRFYKG
jgi:3-hydroxy acid dehydrogenase/malonic semialdehyde reductase